MSTILTRRDLLKMASLGLIVGATPSRSSAGLTRSLLGARGAFCGGRAQPPEPSVDRFEFDFLVTNRFTLPTNDVNLFPANVVKAGKGIAFDGMGDERAFATSVGQKNTWYSITGGLDTSLQARYDKYGKYTRYCTFDGEVQLSLGNWTLSAALMAEVISMKVPTWITSFNTAASDKPATNCTDITFVKRTFTEAKAMHALATTVFANAIWHCSDGDFHADGSNA